MDIYSKYAWIISLKKKRGITITNDFQKLFDGSNGKPKKILVDKGSKFYKRFFQNNDIEIYSTQNEGKSVIAGKFIRTLKNKI